MVGFQTPTVLICSTVFDSILSKIDQYPLQLLNFKFIFFTGSVIPKKNGAQTFPKIRNWRIRKWLILCRAFNQSSCTACTAKSDSLRWEQFYRYFQSIMIQGGAPLYSGYLHNLALPNSNPTTKWIFSLFMR